MSDVNFDSYHPRCHPIDDTKIAYIKEGGPVREIIIRDGSSNEISLLKDRTCSDLAWSPNGGKIAHTCKSNRSGGRTGIFIMDAEDADGDGVGDNRLELNLENFDGNNDFNYSSPVWAPDGDWLLFARSDATLPPDDAYLAETEIFAVHLTGNILSNRYALAEHYGIASPMALPSDWK